MSDFSFASLILSYFLVGGGMFTGTLVLGSLKTTSELMFYSLLAAGAFVGGFFAARASRGSTILEPALGALAVVATIVGLMATTSIGKLLWGEAHEQTVKYIAATAASGGGGALVGAFLSEKLLGDATPSSIPWILYTALSTFGASMLAALFGWIFFVTGETGATADQIARMILLGVGAGCLLAGLAVGASARTRPLLAALLGGGAGVAGFFALAFRVLKAGDHRDTATLAVAGGAGCVVTLIGALVGWAAVGRRYAD
jgi:hypothetical protein